MLIMVAMVMEQIMIMPVAAEKPPMKTSRGQVGVALIQGQSQDKGVGLGKRISF